MIGDSETLIREAVHGIVDDRARGVYLQRLEVGVIQLTGREASLQAGLERMWNNLDGSSTVLFSKHEVALLDEQLSIAAVLSACSIRLSTLAVRNKNPLLVNSALLCLSLDDDMIDWRDVLRGLSVAFDAGGRLLVDSEASLHRVMPFVSPQRHHTMSIGFLRRGPGMRSVETMGLRGVGDGGAFQYVTYL